MARRQRVVLFTAGHTEPNGGLAQHSRLLAEGFARAGWDVRTISRAGTLRRPVLTRQENLVVVELPGFSRRRLGAALYLLCAVPLGLLWTRRAVGCLSVHLGTTTVAAGISAAAWGRPHLALSTSSGPYGEVAEVSRCRPTGLRRRLLRRATFLVAQSSATAPELDVLTDPERITIVPNPVELPEPPPLTGNPRVLFLGRLSVEKDPSTLLAAWKRVVAARPEARLDFVGAGGEWRSVEDALRAEVAADERLSTSVSFAGWSADVPGVLADHDVFVQSSATFEGMSNSLLEACSHGRVVVASDIAPNRAVLGDDHPLLFEMGNADDLAARLEAAIGDPAVRADARGRALAAVAPNAIERVVARHAELLLGGHQPERSTSA